MLFRSDKSIQEKIKIYVEQHKGEKIEVVMQKFSEETGIKKVRCKNRVQTPSWLHHWTMELRLFDDLLCKDKSY